jgi:hypothetical protein
MYSFESRLRISFKLSSLPLLVFRLCSAIGRFFECTHHNRLLEKCSGLEAASCMHSQGQNHRCGSLKRVIDRIFRKVSNFIKASKNFLTLIFTSTRLYKFLKFISAYTENTNLIFEAFKKTSSSDTQFALYPMRGNQRKKSTNERRDNHEKCFCKDIQNKYFRK